MRDRLLGDGLVDQGTLDDALAALSDVGFTELSPGMITTGGQRPLGSARLPRRPTQS
jgi:hypothetical protein